MGKFEMFDLSFAKLLFSESIRAPAANLMVAPAACCYGGWL